MTGRITESGEVGELFEITGITYDRRERKTYVRYRPDRWRTSSLRFALPETVEAWVWANYGPELRNINKQIKEKWQVYAVGRWMPAPEVEGGRVWATFSDVDVPILVLRGSTGVTSWPWPWPRTSLRNRHYRW
jgi:hypothetical protein